MSQFNDKAIWGSGGADPLVLKLGTRCRCTISFTLRPLCLAEKGPPVTIQLEDDWDPLPVKTLWRRGKSLGPTRNRTTIPQSYIPQRSHYVDWAIPAYLVTGKKKCNLWRSGVDSADPLWCLVGVKAAHRFSLNVAQNRVDPYLQVSRASFFHCLTTLFDGEIPVSLNVQR
jgi:hypothetical protein